jgi:16S rRNA (uracil1498-N3)-methyltransferase
MHRFFIGPAEIHDQTAMITGPEAHHLRTVLRLTVGDLVCLFDGTGNVYEATITRIAKGEVATRIIASRTAAPSPVLVHISQALLKGKKMDLLIQKANELGIDILEPFVSIHCENKSRNAEREQRWRRVVIESCKQCGRPVPLTCRPEVDFPIMLRKSGEFDLKLIFWEQEQELSLSRLFAEQGTAFRSVQAIIGPEGGFSADEINQAKEAGFLSVSLGRRTLRAETASIAVMAILQHRLGNLES